MNDKDSYHRQLKLTILNLLGETPNFIALLISAVSTKAVLVFIDLLDTAGNVLRNVLIVLISGRLKKDLRFKYNYGIGKIEALSAMICDFLMVSSLAVMLFFAVKDLIHPHATGGFLLFAVAVKVINVLGDLFVFWRQKKICKTSDSLVLKSALSVALKNVIFDTTTLTALLLIGLFGDKRIIWYISPVVSLVLGGYLLIAAIKRLSETLGVMLDKSTDEATQMAILQTLTSFYEKYDTLKDVKSRVSGGTVIIDLELGFSPEMTYEEMLSIAKEFKNALSEKIPKCEVSLKITAE